MKTPLILIAIMLFLCFTMCDTRHQTEEHNAVNPEPTCDFGFSIKDELAKYHFSDYDILKSEYIKDTTLFIVIVEAISQSYTPEMWAFFFDKDCVMLSSKKLNDTIEKKGFYLVQPEQSRRGLFRKFINRIKP